MDDSRWQGDYESGLRDGKIVALEALIAKHDERFEHHERRLTDHESRFAFLERIVWGLLGAISLIQFGPAIQGWLAG